MAAVDTWLQAIEQLTELATYIIWDQLTGTYLQTPNLREDLIYLKVNGELPLHIRDQFANEYHPQFIELRVNALHNIFIAKAERALEISGLQIEEFLENQTMANRLVNPADPFRLGRDYSD